MIIGLIVNLTVQDLTDTKIEETPAPSTHEEKDK